MPATLIGLNSSMPYKKHQNRPPSKDQSHGVIENLRISDVLRTTFHHSRWRYSSSSTRDWRYILGSDDW
ncbi:MAG: hypothetical protein NT090_05835, partial [Acidobacteria bacterium]|nr:hypothetical protein [Acidobacteriota bacterium]